MNYRITKTFVTLIFSAAFLAAGCGDMTQDASDLRIPKGKEFRDIMAEEKKSGLKLSNDIQMTASADALQLHLSEPVFINLEIQNNSPNTVKFYSGQIILENLLLTVTYPDGRQVQPAKLKPGEGISLSGVATMKPGELYSQKILLNKWTDFSSAGQYLIKGRLTNLLETEKGKSLGTDLTFAVTLDIKPKNDSHLKAVCEELLKNIREMNNHAGQSAIALTYIKDPLAVPYLKTALDSDKLNSVIINNLREIGDRNAVDLLIYALKGNSGSEKAVLAESSLKIIESKSSDSELKEKIKQALNSMKTSNS